MSELFNVETRQKESLPQDQLEKAIVSGTHAYKSNADVNVFAPGGRLVSVKGQDLADALRQGYKVETPLQFASRKYAEENKGISGAAKVAIREAADQLSFGVTEAALKATESDLEKAKYQALKNENELASIAGNLGGFVGSMFYGGPLFKAASKAGLVGEGAAKLATKAVETALKNQGLGQFAAARAAGSIAANTLETGAKLGVEGLALMTPKALTEAALGEPKEAAETLAWGFGIGALLGGVGGFASKSFEKSQATLDKAQEFLAQKLDPEGFAAIKADKMAQEAAEKEAAKEALKGAKAAPPGAPEAVAPVEKASVRVNPGEVEQKAAQMEAEEFANAAKSAMDPLSADFIDAAVKEGADKKTLVTLTDVVGKRKQNAQEIIDAASRLGVQDQVLAGQVADNNLIQGMSFRLADRPTQAGFKARAQVQGQFKAMEQGVLRSIGRETAEVVARNPSDVGSSIASNIAEMVGAKYDSFSQLYERVNKAFPSIPVNERGLNQIAKNILNTEINGSQIVSKLPNSSTARLLSEVADNITRQTTLQDLRNFQTYLRKAYNPATLSAIDKEALGIVQEKLGNAIERHLNQFVKKQGPGAEADALKALLPEKKVADAQYREFREFLSELAPELGYKKRIDTPTSVIRFLEDVDGEKLFKAMSKSKKLGLLEKEVPVAYKEFLEAKKDELLSGAMKDGKLELAQFHRKVDALPWEIKEKIIAADPQAYLDARTLRESFSIKGSLINPSGTSFAQSMDKALEGGFLSKIPGVGLALEFGFKNVQDAAMEKLVNKVSNIEALLVAEAAKKEAANELSRIPAMIEKMATKAKETVKVASVGAVARAFDSEGDRKDFMAKIRKTLYDSQGNPEKVQKKAGQWVNWTEKQGAPTIAMELSGQLNKAMAYLQNEVPKQMNPNPLVKQRWEPSDTELASFERKASVVLNPFSVIDDLGNGSLTKDQLTALQTVYPSIYEKIRSGVVESLTTFDNTVPYPMRIKLSLLFGASLDQSLAQVPQLQQTFSAQTQSMNTKNLSLAKNTQTQSQRLGV